MRVGGAEVGDAGGGRARGLAVHGDGEPRSAMMAMIGARLSTPYTALTPARMLLSQIYILISDRRV